MRNIIVLIGTFLVISSLGCVSIQNNIDDLIGGTIYDSVEINETYVVNDFKKVTNNNNSNYIINFTDSKNNYTLNVNEDDAILSLDYNESGNNYLIQYNGNNKWTMESPNQTVVNNVFNNDNRTYWIVR